MFRVIIAGGGAFLDFSARLLDRFSHLRSRDSGKGVTFRAQRDGDVGDVTCSFFDRQFAPRPEGTIGALGGGVDQLRTGFRVVADLLSCCGIA